MECIQRNCNPPKLMFNSTQTPNHLISKHLSIFIHPPHIFYAIGLTISTTTRTIHHTSAATTTNAPSPPLPPLPPTPQHNSHYYTLHHNITPITTLYARTTPPTTPHYTYTTRQPPIPPPNPHTPSPTLSLDMDFLILSAKEFGDLWIFNSLTRVE